MKKILISFILILLIISFGLLSYKVEAEDVNIELSLTPTATINLGDKNTVELTLSLGEFTGIEGNPTLGYEAVLDYDENLIEQVTVQELNGWDVDYVESTKKILGTVDSAEPNKDITKIVITLKQDIEETTLTEVKLNDILLTNDENDFEFNLTSKINIQVPKPEPKKEENKAGENKAGITNTNPDNANSGKPTTTIVSGTDSTLSEKEIPKAGIGNIILIVVIIIAIIGLFSFIRYKTIKIK